MLTETRVRFLPFTEQFEGHTDWLYLDVKGLVTIGYGNLVDPIGLVTPLVFVRPDGSRAGAAEIQVAWHQVKNRTDLCTHGGGAYKPLTSIRATADSIAALVDSKLAQFEATLKTYFPDWEEWPWQAQLGTLSMAWAMGPHFPSTWPKFTTACRKQDWAAAALNASCSDKELARQNDSFRRRNAANVELFHEADVSRSDDRSGVGGQGDCQA